MPEVAAGAPSGRPAGWRRCGRAPTTTARGIGGVCHLVDIDGLRRRHRRAARRALALACRRTRRRRRHGRRDVPMRRRPRPRRPARPRRRHVGLGQDRVPEDAVRVAVPQQPSRRPVDRHRRLQGRRRPRRRPAAAPRRRRRDQPRHRAVQAHDRHAQGRVRCGARTCSARPGPATSTRTGWPGRQRPELPPLPRLLVVVDEFGELLASEGGREQLKELESITRIGRALGLHLLLVTQNFEGNLPAADRRQRRAAHLPARAEAGALQGRARLRCRGDDPRPPRRARLRPVPRPRPDRVPDRPRRRPPARPRRESDTGSTCASCRSRRWPARRRTERARGRARRGDRHVRARRSGSARRRSVERVDAQRGAVADRAAAERQRRRRWRRRHAGAGVPIGLIDLPEQQRRATGTITDRDEQRRRDRRSVGARPRGAHHLRDDARPAARRRRRAHLRHRPARAQPGAARRPAALRRRRRAQRATGAAHRALAARRSPPSARSMVARPGSVERLGARRRSPASCRRRSCCSSAAPTAC